MLGFKKKRYYIIKSLLIILFLFIFFVIVALFFNKLIFKPVSLNNNDIKVVYNNSNVVEIKNILPISDTLAKQYNGEGLEKGSQGYILFTVENMMTQKRNFEVYLTRNSDGDNTNIKEINENYVKLYLTDENDMAIGDFKNNKLPSFADLAVINDKPNSKLLFRGSLNSLEKKEFKLRVWLSDTYSISLEEELFSFEIFVRVV